MQRLLLFSVVALLAGCGTSSKKLMNLPPLAKDAPVQVFWSEPNVKYEKVCEIEAKGNNSFGGMYREKEDFEPMFKQEARKCGANGVIFKWLHGYKQGDVTATATGVRLLGESAVVVSKEAIEAFAIAVQGKDTNKVKEILGKVPKDPASRAPTDEILLSRGLFLVAAKGSSCDKKMVDLLQTEYQTNLESFEKGAYAASKNTILCYDVVAKSLPKMKDRVEALKFINEAYVTTLNGSASEKDVAAYNKTLVVASNLIVEECTKSSTSPSCAMKGIFSDFTEKTKASKSAAQKKNSQDVSKILK